MGDKARRSSGPTPLPVRRALRSTGDDVTSWRKLRGLTQAQLADRAGIGLNTLRRLEEGDGGVTLENALRVLRALGLLDAVVRGLDPQQTDLGRMRVDESLPKRVRPRALGEP